MILNTLEQAKELAVKLQTLPEEQKQKLLRELEPLLTGMTADIEKIKAIVARS